MCSAWISDYYMIRSQQDLHALDLRSWQCMQWIPLLVGSCAMALSRNNSGWMEYPIFVHRWWRQSLWSPSPPLELLPSQHTQWICPHHTKKGRRCNLLHACTYISLRDYPTEAWTQKECMEERGIRKAILLPIIMIICLIFVQTTGAQAMATRVLMFYLDQY